MTTQRSITRRLLISCYNSLSHRYQGCSPTGSQSLLSKFWKILGAQPPSNAKLLNIFLKFFYSAVDLETYFNICLQCQDRTDGGVTPFHVEIMAANQPHLNCCWKIFVTKKYFCLAKVWCLVQQQGKTKEAIFQESK